MAGIIPALLLGLSLIILVLIIAHRENFRRARSSRVRQALKIALDAVWGMVTIVIILGGILSGVFTPTEVGGRRLRLCLSGHDVRLSRFQVERVAEADRACRAHGRHGHDHDRLLDRLRLHDGDHARACDGHPVLRRHIQRTSTCSCSGSIFCCWCSGTFMDLAPMLLICTPIFLPVIKAFGIDPVHFGIIMILNLGIGLLTPPVGPTMVVGCAIGRVSMEAVSREYLDFLHADADRAGVRDLCSGAVALAAERCAQVIQIGRDQSSPLGERLWQPNN